MRAPHPTSTFPSLRNALLAAVLIQAAPTALAQVHAYGPQLEGFDYPHPVQRFEFTSQAQALSMAYLDVAPASAQRPHRRAAARQELLRRDLGIDDRRLDGCRLSRDRAGPDRLLQVQPSRSATSSASGNWPPTRMRCWQVLGISTRNASSATRWAACWPRAMRCSIRRQRSSWCWSIRSGWRTGRPKACPGAASTRWYARELKTDSPASGITSRTCTTTGSGSPTTSVGSICWPACTRDPARQAVAWNQALTSDMVFNQPVCTNSRA